MKHPVSSFFILLFLTSMSFSQGLENRLLLNAGFSFPLGDFAKKDGSENAGFAKFGFGAGAEYDLLFGESGFAWSTSFHYIANDYQTEEEFKWIPDFQLQDTGAYTNYALLTGVKYQKPDRTMTDKEVSQIRQKIVEHLGQKCGAILRT